jgi:branched-subunit amino acid ABC-type transport system permease component
MRSALLTWAIAAIISAIIYGITRIPSFAWFPVYIVVGVALWLIVRKFRDWRSARKNEIGE